MAGRLDGKVALITGAASGIGAATARRFAREGAKVVAVDIDQDGARRVVDEIRAVGGQACALRADVADARDAEAMVGHAVETFGGLDVLHNNATSGGAGFLGEMRHEEWDRTVAVNLTAPWLASRFALPVMRARGGAIVNMSSAVALIAEHGLGAYGAAKAGVISLTRSLAIEYGRYKIRVNCICPGAIETPPTRALIGAVEGMREKIVRANPLGRLGTAEEVASLVLFLASEEASFITGATYLVDGGAMATHNLGLLGEN